MAGDAFSLAHLTSPRLFVEYAHDHLFDRLPWALLAAGIVFGGLFVVWLIKRILAYIVLPRRYHSRYVRAGALGGRPVWHQDTRRPVTSFAHLALESFSFVAVVLVIWIGAHVAGFNFWTSSLMTVGLGLVGTYMFGTALQQIGSGYFVYLTDKVEEGWFVEIGGVSGRVREMHPLYVELETLDAHGGVIHHHVPMVQLLAGVVTRHFREEARMAHSVLSPNDLPPQQQPQYARGARKMV